MTTQLALVAAAAALAAAYLGWRMYRAWRGGCASGCSAGGCATPKGAGNGLIAADELLARARGRRVGK